MLKHYLLESEGVDGKMLFRNFYLFSNVWQFSQKQSVA